MAAAPEALPEINYDELTGLSAEEKTKNIKRRNKLLRQIEELEQRQVNGEKLGEDQAKKISRKQHILDELKFLNESWKLVKYTFRLVGHF